MQVKAQAHDDVAINQERQASTQRSVKCEWVEVDQRIEVSVTLRGKTSDERYFRSFCVKVASRAELQGVERDRLIGGEGDAGIVSAEIDGQPTQIWKVRRPGILRMQASKGDDLLDV